MTVYDSVQLFIDGVVQDIGPAQDIGTIDVVSSGWFNAYCSRYRLCDMVSLSNAMWHRYGIRRHRRVYP
jgi:hypothetical protein